MEYEFSELGSQVTKALCNSTSHLSSAMKANQKYGFYKGSDLSDKNISCDNIKILDDRKISLRGTYYIKVSDLAIELPESFNIIYEDSGQMCSDEHYLSYSVVGDKFGVLSYRGVFPSSNRSEDDPLTFVDAANLLKIMRTPPSAGGITRFKQKSDGCMVKKFLDSSEGYTSELPDNFARMLYFSAVTITTLGYGDIYPITNKARFAVMIEALLGIIIIGLFLNSVAQKAAHGRDQ